MADMTGQTLQVQSLDPSPASGNTIVLENVKYTVQVKKEERVILNNINAILPPGHLLAIMGPSGAGKTTLLNVIADRVRPTSGSRLLNGRYYENVPRLSHQFAYVMQDDMLLGNLTVEETLMFSALIRLPRIMTLAEKRKRVDDTLAELGLLHIRNSRIGAKGKRGISGGEQKRVAVGVDLIHDPAILFLDEPTSGLDSFAAESIMRTLNLIARNGRSIVCTIHQPSSEIYALMDTLMLLAKGNVVFHGKASDALPYFADMGYPCPQYTNPCDFFMKTLRVEVDAASMEIVAGLRNDDGDNRAQRFAQAWIEHEQRESKDIRKLQMPSEIIVAEESAYAVGFLTQFVLLLKRCFVNSSRDAIVTKARLGQTIFITLISALIFLQIGKDQQSIQMRQGAIFFLLINQSMMPLMGIVLTIPLEKVLVLREHANGMYAVTPYFIAKNIVEVVFQLGFPFLSCAIFYPIVGLAHGFDKFFIFAAYVVLTSLAAQSLGILVSCAAPNAEVALALAPALMMPFLVFGGFFTNVGSVRAFIGWLRHISFFKYGFEALAKNEFSGAKFTCPAPPAPCYHTGEQVLRLLGFDQSSFWKAAVILISMTIIMRTLAWLLILLHARPKKV